MNHPNRRQFLQRAGLVLGTTGLLPTNLTNAAGVSAPERPARATAQTLNLEFSRHGLGFEASGIELRRARPRVTLRVDPGEDVVELRPPDRGSVEVRMCDTFCGPAQETTMVWKDARGYVVRWTVSQLRQRAGFTVRLAFQNLSDAPVRLTEMALCETQGEDLRCAGRPEDWLLSSLDIALRIGHLGEVLAPIKDAKWSGYGGPFRTFILEDRAADGHWRFYKDWLTLYSARDHAGLVMGAVGAPVADVRFDCRVSAGRIRLAVVSQMNDVVVEPGETRGSQEVLFLAEPYVSAVETALRWVAATHGARTHRGPVVGWCSWYDMLDKITGAHVEEVVKAAAHLREQIPLQVIDVAYLKTRDTLTAEELKTWHGFVGLLGGATLISEPINQADYQAEARRLEILTPPVPERGRSFRGDVDRHHQQFGFVARRLWGDFAVVQLFNVTEQPQALALTRSGLEALGERFHVWSFWDERYLGVAGPGFRTPELAPHACLVLRLTPVGDDPARPLLIGSNLHLGMGAAEIAGWRASPMAITIRLNDGGARSGRLIIHSQKALSAASSDACEVRAVRESPSGIWSVDLVGRQRGKPQTIRLKVAS